MAAGGWPSSASLQGCEKRREARGQAGTCLQHIRVQTTLMWPQESLYLASGCGQAESRPQSGDAHRDAYAHHN